MIIYLQIWCLYYTAFCYFCFDNFLALLNIFITGQFHILRNKLETLYDGNKSVKNIYNYSEKNEKIKVSSRTDGIRRNFVECVKQHQLLISLTEQVEKVYSFINLVQTVLFSLLLCLVGYQLISVC